MFLSRFSENFIFSFKFNKLKKKKKLKSQINTEAQKKTPVLAPEFNFLFLYLRNDVINIDAFY